ncbi:hypothetical protein ACFL0O_02900 [Thermodesulfobacteriota bacterium]
MDSLENLEDRLRKLEEKIKAAKLHLPAHSTKPPVMITLLDLEDERDAIQEQIDAIRKEID